MNESGQEPDVLEEGTTMIHDIRGTHGSGKSTCVHRLLEKYEHEVLQDDWKEDCGIFVPELNLRVLGLYDNPCGGCDWLGNQVNMNYVQHIAQSWYEEHDGPIIMEGILVAHTFERWFNFSEDKDVTYWFLDTPMETCIERVAQRREAKGNSPDFNTKNLVSDFHQINNVKLRMQEGGRVVKTLDHTRAPEIIEEALRCS